jgi:hypothetical protein
MRPTVKDLLFALLSGNVGELYPREKIIPTPITDRLLMLEPIFIQHKGEVMLLDLGGENRDPNPKRKNGYNESTFEQAYMNGLIESVDCEHRPHLHYMLTPKGLDEAVKIWGKQSATVFIIYGGRMPDEDELTPTKIVPVTADGSDFDMASLPRRLTTDEVEFLGYPRPVSDNFHYNVCRENCEDWIEISDPEWMELIRKADAMPQPA